MKIKRYCTVLFCIKKTATGKSAMIRTRKIAVPKAKSGRPRNDDIERRQALVLDVAGEMFLRLGFDATTMDAVAEIARTSKRTLYAHYPDKGALFNAVLRRLINRWLVPIDQAKSRSSNLETTLRALAHYLATFAVTPQHVSVNRIIISESKRRPEFGALADEAARKPAIAAIVAILRKHRKKLDINDLELAAEQFMSLAIDSCLRRAYSGSPPSPDDIEQWVSASVRLFLHGVSKRFASHAANDDRSEETT
ncbi:TetR/AcrR family transcriptional regulator [Hyphomicrobium sp. DY-1]|uniref:TetR/AcrR family transcriptional regulator n=1 Tax=Hyphomicrobium sp. DY-1 TaxID=3075650 RepID=UPI0039C3A415